MSSVNLQNLSIFPDSKFGSGNEIPGLVEGRSQGDFSDFSVMLNILSSLESENANAFEEEKNESRQSSSSPAEEEMVANLVQASSVSVILETKVFQNIHDADSSFFKQDEIMNSDNQDELSENKIVINQENEVIFKDKDSIEFDNLLNRQVFENQTELAEVEKEKVELPKDIASPLSPEHLAVENEFVNQEPDPIRLFKQDDNKIIENIANLKPDGPESNEIPQVFNETLEVITEKLEQEKSENFGLVGAQSSQSESVVLNEENSSKNSEKSTNTNVSNKTLPFDNLKKNDESLRKEFNFQKDSIPQEVVKYKTEDGFIENKISEFETVAENLDVLANKDASQFRLRQVDEKENIVVNKDNKMLKDLGDENINKISLNLKSLSKSKNKESIKIELNPKDLGSLTIEFEKDITTGLSKVTFTTEKFTAFDLLSRATQEIQKIINDSGIRVDDSSLKFEMQNNSERRGSNNEYFEDKVSSKDKESKVSEYMTSYSFTTVNDEINIIA